IISIQTEVDVEPSVAIVIGHCCVCKGSSRRFCEGKCIGLPRKLAIALVQKKQWTGVAHHQQVLQPVILKISKDRTRSRIQNADAGAIGRVLERSIATIAIEPVRQSRRLTYIDVVVSVAG